jgi:RNA polymerase sigma factor (sigma-70 family)
LLSQVQGLIRLQVVSGREPTDGQLLQALRREAQASALLYDRYASRLVGYLRQQGASEDAALDATQEVFARLIVDGRKVRPGKDGTIWPWLAVTGRNLLRDWQRRGAVEARARQRLGLWAASDETVDLVTRVDARRHRGRLRVALARLSPEQRRLVTARVLDERDYAEIASEAGASEASVRRRVSRGLRAMQTFLQGGNS